MGTIKADTITGLADPNKITLPSGDVTNTTFAMGATLSVGSTTATLNFGNTVIANASAGSTTITAEGGSTTTNLQQGLAKVWCQYNSADALQDSFNVTSLTDDATGKTTVTIANDMANDDYSATASGSDGDSDTTLHSLVASVYATGSVKFQAFRQTNGANDAPALNDFNLSNVTVHGDLA